MSDTSCSPYLTMKVFFFSGSDVACGGGPLSLAHIRENGAQGSEERTDATSWEAGDFGGGLE